MASMDGSTTGARDGLLARVRARLADSSEGWVTNRLAAIIFIIRVLSAALAYVSQILLARGAIDAVALDLPAPLLLLGMPEDALVHDGAAHLDPRATRDVGRLVGVTVARDMEVREDGETHRGESSRNRRWETASRTSC